MTDTAQTGCAQVEQVADYALRVLPADETLTFASHLAGCEECRRELAALRPTVAAFVEWPTAVVRSPVPLWDRLAQRIGIEAGPPEARWADAPAWKGVAPGIRCKLLATDHATGMVSMLVQLAPGTAYPAHTHAGIEELHLLEGELWIEERKLYPGDFSRAEPGTGDTRVFSETGCTCLLVTSYRDRLR